MLEEYFRRAMVLSRGSFSVFFSDPFSAVLLTSVAAFAFFQSVSSIRKRYLMRSGAGAGRVLEVAKDA